MTSNREPELECCFVDVLTQTAQYKTPKGELLTLRRDASQSSILKLFYNEEVIGHIAVNSLSGGRIFRRLPDRVFNIGAYSYNPEEGYSVTPYDWRQKESGEKRHIHPLDFLVEAFEPSF